MNTKEIILKILCNIVLILFTDILKKQILNKSDINQKLLRIAYQIAEDNLDESEVVFVGIAPKGDIIARALESKLREILPQIKTTVESLTIDKDKPLSTPVKISCPTSNLENKSIILIDDVVNSGRTTFYAMQVFTTFPCKKLKTAILVDRKHKDFPITSDYVGLSLSTTLLDHILVEVTENGIEGAYLL